MWRLRICDELPSQMGCSAVLLVVVPSSINGSGGNVSSRAQRRKFYLPVTLIGPGRIVSQAGLETAYRLKFNWNSPWWMLAVVFVSQHATMFDPMNANRPSK